MPVFAIGSGIAGTILAIRMATATTAAVTAIAIKTAVVTAAAGAAY